MHLPSRQEAHRERQVIIMKKDIGLVQAVYPMPVLMVAAYDANGKVNAMNVAWGQICDDNKIILFIGEGKKTWLNIQESKAFTVALADQAHMKEADFFGIASGNKINDKFERTGLHAVKSDKVNAPIIEELANAYEDRVIIGKYNVDDDTDLGVEYGIRNIPTLLFFKDGKMVEKHVGTITRDALTAKVEALL